MYRISRTWAVLTAAIVAACGTNSPVARDGGGAPSGLSTIEVAVPEATAEVFGETAQLALLTHVHFLVQPKDQTCDKATKVDKLAAYTASNVGDTVYNGCDYLLTLSLGTQVTNPAEVVASAPVAPLAEGLVSKDQQNLASQKIKSLYTNFKAIEISSSSLEASGGKLTVSVTLDLTQFGQQNGFTTDVNTANSAVAGTDVPFRTLASGTEVTLHTEDDNTLSAASVGNHTIQGAEDWAKISPTPLTTVDWANKMIIGYARNGAGLSAKIEKITATDTEIVVSVRETKNGQVVPNVQTPYFDIVEISKQSKPVRFDVSPAS